jgi:hypothetical protein
MGAVKATRVLLSDVINLHLERATCAERVHPDRLDDRGHARKAEPKLLPSESRDYRDKGIISPRMQQVLDIRAARHETRAVEQADACAYWTQRKVALGITDTMDAPAQLAAVCVARAQVRDHAPMRAVEEAYAGVEVDDRALGDLAREAYAQTWTDAQQIWSDAKTAWELRAVGDEVAEDAWRDAVLLWAEDQGTRALQDVGWESVQDARDEGMAALVAAVEEQQARERAHAWQSVEQELQTLAQQLDALHEREGGTGAVRIRLWDREHGQGL